MFKRGEVYENPVTGERAVVRVGTAETNGARLVADLYLRPGARVSAPHYHPGIHERFTVVRGQLGYTLGSRHEVAQPGQSFEIAPGVIHGWWNAGETEAQVLVEIAPAERFEAAIRHVFFFAQDGKTDKKGMPSLLQLSLFAREFDDVIRFTRPPRWFQQMMFFFLAPIARWCGYQGSYPEYLTRPANAVVEVL